MSTRLECNDEIAPEFLPTKLDLFRVIREIEAMTPSFTGTDLDEVRKLDLLFRKAALLTVRLDVILEHGII